MNACVEFENLLNGLAPILALAPMQDVTDAKYVHFLNQEREYDAYAEAALS